MNKFLLLLSFLVPVIATETTEPEKYPLATFQVRTVQQKVLDKVLDELRIDSIEKATLTLTEESIKDYRLDSKNSEIDVIYGEEMNLSGDIQTIINYFYDGTVDQSNFQDACGYCASCNLSMAWSENNSPMATARIKPYFPGTFSIKTRSINGLDQVNNTWNVYSIPTIIVPPGAFFNVSLEFVRVFPADTFVVEDLDQIGVRLNSSSGVMYLFGFSQNLPESSIVKITLQSSSKDMALKIGIKVVPSQATNTYRDSFEIIMDTTTLALDEKIQMIDWISRQFGSKKEVLRNIEFASDEGALVLKGNINNTYSCGQLDTILLRVAEETNPIPVKTVSLKSEPCRISPKIYTSRPFLEITNEIANEKPREDKPDTNYETSMSSTTSAAETQTTKETVQVANILPVLEKDDYQIQKTNIASKNDCSLVTIFTCFGSYSNRTVHMISVFIIWISLFLVLFCTVYIAFP